MDGLLRLRTRISSRVQAVDDLAFRNELTEKRDGMCGTGGNRKAGRGNSERGRLNKKRIKAMFTMERPGNRMGVE
ncbi:MAG: hypothetical protein C0478_08645 [Planctomyces sp.]|jgi:hypothetical protein|nr:hypothetical protein [Planctomyces sp.]